MVGDKLGLAFGGERPGILKERPGHGEQPHIRHCAHSEKIGLDNRALIISPDMAGLLVQPRLSSDSPAQPTATRPFSAPLARPTVPTSVIRDALMNTRTVHYVHGIYSYKLRPV